MIYLYTQYYRDKNADRQAEIDACLQANLDHQDIAGVTVLYEAASGVEPPEHPKIRRVPIEHLEGRHASGRPTFSQMLEVVCQASGPDDVNIICNSDIYFDSSVVDAEQLQAGECYCLGRWDVKGEESWLWNVPFGQDAWFFRGKPQRIEADFPFGYPGCDNRFAWECRKAGYRVLNPCRCLRALHLHASGIRNYPANQVQDPGLVDRIPRPYLWISPAIFDEWPAYEERLPDAPKAAPAPPAPSVVQEGRRRRPFVRDVRVARPHRR